MDEFMNHEVIEWEIKRKSFCERQRDAIREMESKRDEQQLSNRVTEERRNQM